MIKELELSLSPEQAADSASFIKRISEKLDVSKDSISDFTLIRRSIDARKADVKLLHRFKVYIDEKAPETNSIINTFEDVSNAPEVIVVGAGPAGLYAALKLIEQGLRPIVIERGKDVHERKKDIALLNRNIELNPDSNYCFGEGGAGTFSDGKLFTRSSKRGDIHRILQLFIEHGADASIAIDAHPHIGTDKLPTIIENMRYTIQKHGGEVIFNTRVSELIIEQGEAKGVKTSEGETFRAKAVILASGHSARDIFDMLSRQKVMLEAKPFAMGVRLEHPQELINRIQYHSGKPNPMLPAASYSLTHQVKDRGVFSFCMCPGGTIVPASTAPEELVVNGMSNSKRNSPFANSGIAVQINIEDFQKYSKHGAFAGLEFQKSVEKAAWIAGGKSQTAPAQRMADFVSGRLTKQIPRNSYHPGTVSAPMQEILPSSIGQRLQSAFTAWGNKMRGFLTNEAIILGVESRTSSPIRIPRDKETLEHMEIQNLYPCGEGAGYAGGIVSSAMDGENCAMKVAMKLKGF